MMAYARRTRSCSSSTAWAGADPDVPPADPRGQRVRLAQPVLRATCSCRRRSARSAPTHRPEFTVIDAPSFKADPARHGTRSEVFIVVHFGRKLVLIGGTQLRRRDQEVDLHDAELHRCRCRASCSMHCSANIGAAGDTALFFGLSGTGKTTLSSDPRAAADWRRRAWLERHAASSTSRAAATRR